MNMYLSTNDTRKKNKAFSDKHSKDYMKKKKKDDKIGLIIILALLTVSVSISVLIQAI
tara:strand:+ start:67 stop:240 length:174 start_codon:yes stop_codon:yes gene_type:complete